MSRTKQPDTDDDMVYTVGLCALRRRSGLSYHQGTEIRCVVHYPREH